VTATGPQQLQQILGTFDDAALAALASPGLVRRARKDLLQLPQLEVVEQPAGLRVIGPDWEVEVPWSGPQQARDNTPATGITRQILAATIWLREHWQPGSIDPVPPAPSQPVATEPSVADLLASLSWRDLGRWGGKRRLEWCWSETELLRSVELPEGPVPIVRFPTAGVEVRFPAVQSLLPGRGVQAKRKLLEQTLTTAHPRQHRRWVMSAVLAWRLQQGPAFRAPAESLSSSSEHSQSQAALLGQVRDFLESLLVLGLQRPAELAVQQARQLMICCQGAALPRLAGLLGSVTEQLELSVTQNVQFNPARLCGQLAYANALATAMQNTLPAIPRHLAGELRQEAFPLGELLGFGCAAYPWETQRGVAGLTVLIFDQLRQRFWNWSLARRATLTGFDPQREYRQAGVWHSGLTPQQLSRSLIRVVNVSASAAGRLSDAGDTQLVSRSPLPEDLPSSFGERGFACWERLATYARSTARLGLHQPHPLDRWVAVFPHQWGVPTFDQREQLFRWPVQDARGSMLELRVLWSEQSRAVVTSCEALAAVPERLQGVIGQLAWQHGRLLLQPWSLLVIGQAGLPEVLNLAFDRAEIEQVVSREDWQRASEKAREPLSKQHSAGSVSPARPAGSLTRLIHEADELLQAWAESGWNSQLSERVRQAAELAQPLETAGLPVLASALKELAGSEVRPGARAFLWAKYLVDQHLAAMEICRFDESGVVGVMTTDSA
jgi:hypothetical protein